MWYYNNVVNLSSTTVGEPCKSLIRGYGGIGRRDRFRFYWQHRAGSSPVTRTITDVLTVFMPVRTFFISFSGTAMNTFPFNKNNSQISNENIAIIKDYIEDVSNVTQTVRSVNDL